LPDEVSATIRPIPTTPASTAYLTPAEEADIDAQVAAIEARTGVQVATAIVGKTDNYAELPWKAFALGASLSAFAVALADILRPQWGTAGVAIATVTTILATGAALALATVCIPAIARLFLHESRCEVEVRQYAESLFLRHRLFATRNRKAVLILIALFERRIEILHDVGLNDRVAPDEWQTIISRMTPHLRSWQPFVALQESLAALGDLLSAKGFPAPPAGLNDIPDSPIEERGT
jgi:putative membrane protein